MFFLSCVSLFYFISLNVVVVMEYLLLIVDAVYENVQKRTYLSMLIEVGIFLPLLVGLLLLYPWLAGSHKIQYTPDIEDREKREDEAMKPISCQSQ